MRLEIACVVVSLTGCIEPRLVDCGDYLCPRGSTCVEPHLCAEPGQMSVCNSQPEHAPCTTSAVPSGFCIGGFCLPSVCGDGILAGGEVCDDGNTMGGDGCTARCDSTEVCGDSVVNYEQGEACDYGVPMLSRDGCSSTCTFEIDLWKNITPVAITARQLHSMIYDPTRDVFVVFGGLKTTSPTSATDETWTYSTATATWSLETFTTKPLPRYAATFTWMIDENRGILFGGRDVNNVAMADTWEWSASGWTQLVPMTSPPPRAYAAAAYDENAHAILLVGGTNLQTTYLGDTWQWQVDRWTQTPSSIVGRYDHAIAFDDANNYMLMYGGFGSNGAIDQTARWTGTDWAAFTVDASDRPKPKRGIALGFDAVHRNQLVLFGGQEGGTVHGRTYVWIATNRAWRLLDVNPRPNARTNSAVAEVPGRGVVVLGGNNGSTVLSSMFQYNGTHWSSLSANESPQPYAPVIAYDPITGTALLWNGTGTWTFDGRIWLELPNLNRPTGQTPYRGFAFDEDRGCGILVEGDQTWTLCRCPATGCADVNDTDYEWKALPSAPPMTVTNPAVVYDPVAHRTLLVNSGVGVELYTLDASDVWVAVPPGAAPPPRSYLSVSFDRHRGRLILFGGVGVADDEYLNDLWEWDGTWTQVTPTGPSPSPRLSPMLVYDPIRQTTVLFGGYHQGALNDTWEWNGIAWTRRPDFTTPSPRYFASAFYDRANSRIVLFGGNLSLQDTWQYSYGALDGSAERCLDDIDEDGDGASGCADPDCWGRCSPLCVPDETCDPSSPHCGDTTCSPTESNQLCPGDCPL